MRFSGAAVNELRRRAYRSYVSACMSRATDARKGRFSSVDAERKKQNIAGKPGNRLAGISDIKTMRRKSWAPAS